MGDSLPRTPLNYRAKFETASFILAGEINSRTNKKQTVNDISTRFLPACVDNNKVITVESKQEVTYDLPNSVTV